MPIRIQHDPDVKTLFGSGGTYPIFVCDYCGRRIEDGKLGVYLVARDAHEEGNTTDTAFAHKGSCHDAIAKAGGFRGWGELSGFVIFLARNAELGELIRPDAGPAV
jgi:hypothetical protein